MLLGLPLTSALSCYSDSRSCPCSDTPQTPTHIHTRTLLGRPLTSALGCYLDSCSLLCSDSTRNPALVVLSICLSEYSSASLQYRIHVYRPHSELRVYPRYEFSELHSDGPLGHPCLNSSYKSEPTPSDPIRTSVLVRITIQTLVIQLRSEVRSGPLGPPSLSTLRVPHGSEPLVTAVGIAKLATSMRWRWRICDMLFVNLVIKFSPPDL
jgi:hypothetical protein